MENRAANIPKGAQHAKKIALLAPQQTFGKDNYTIDLDGPEKTYWLGTESGLVGITPVDGLVLFISPIQ
jgi:hypothetical protein